MTFVSSHSHSHRMKCGEGVLEAAWRVCSSANRKVLFPRHHTSVPKIVSVFGTIGELLVENDLLPYLLNNMRGLLKLGRSLFASTAVSETRFKRAEMFGSAAKSIHSVPQRRNTAYQSHHGDYLLV